MLSPAVVREAGVTGVAPLLTDRWVPHSRRTWARTTTARRPPSACTRRCRSSRRSRFVENAKQRCCQVSLNPQLSCFGIKPVGVAAALRLAAGGRERERHARGSRAGGAGGGGGCAHVQAEGAPHLAPLGAKHHTHTGNRTSFTGRASQRKTLCIRHTAGGVLHRNSVHCSTTAGVGSPATAAATDTLRSPFFLSRR